MTIKVATQKATMDTEKLRESLQKVNFIKPYRQLPVLSNALAEFSNGKAILTTTDMERAIKVEIDSTNTEQFSALLPRKTTEKFLIGGNGKVGITIDKRPNRVVLSRDGIGNLNLTTLPIADFPKIPQPENLTWQKLDAKWFCRMIGIVAIACASELSRPVLTGIACNDGKIAATDGFRLHSFKDNRLTFGLGDKQAIIPFETAILIKRLFGKSDELNIAFETAQETKELRRVYFKSNNITLSSELIQGNYPNWEPLIPDTFNCKATFSSPLLMQRLQMIDTGKLALGIVRYIIQKSTLLEQECLIQATIEDEDKYELSCPVKFEGDDAKIAFNYQYIVDAIKPFSVCNMEITSPSSPGKFTGDIEGLTVTVMPMFVQW